MPEPIDHSIEQSQKIFKAALDTVDSQHGHGYSKRNPQLLSAVVNLFTNVYMAKVQGEK